MDTNRVLKICMHIYDGVKRLKRTAEHGLKCRCPNLKVICSSTIYTHKSRKTNAVLKKNIKIKEGDNLSYGRTRKQAKLDEEKTFDDIIKQGPSESAKRQMQHEAYHAYGQKKKAVTEYASVAEFYEARLKGGGASGQEKTPKHELG